MKCVATVLVLVIMGIVAEVNICYADTANDYFNSAYTRHKAGELKEAVNLYTKAIEANHDFAMAYQMRGAAWQKMRQFQMAINDYSMVITCGEPYFRAVGYFNRGVVKNMTGDYAGAIPDFSQAISLDRKMAAAYFHRGISKSRVGDMAGRYEDFCQAAQMGDLDAERWLDRYYPGWKQNRS